MPAYKDTAKIFKALCDEQRLRILEMLKGGDRCACKLLENLEITQSSLSYHMKVLTESGIVKGRQEGKWTYYSIDESGSAEAIAILTRLTDPDEQQKDSSCCTVAP